MISFYNRIAGRSVERLAALSDSIFSVAMTLLVLDLHVPEIANVHSEHDLWVALTALTPRLIMFAMSFITLGIFWTSQQTQLNQFAQCDRHLAWIHMSYLFGVSIMPFSTKLLSEFHDYRIALVLYWLNILSLGLLLLTSWAYATGAGHLKPGIDPQIRPAIYNRLISSQLLYALGALLCLFDNAFSIGFIILIQLAYAFGPGLRGIRLFSESATEPTPAGRIPTVDEAFSQSPPTQGPRS
ncbi:TMEM175 family protein [Isosphaeraceae bacterium EP7]